MSHQGMEKRGPAAVSWLKGTNHNFYEDRFRLLPETIPLVSKSGRGSLYAVFDGIGGAPEGMRAAQHMADVLLRFYQECDSYADSAKGVHQLLVMANQEINVLLFKQLNVLRDQVIPDYRQIVQMVLFQKLRYNIGS